MNLYPVLDCGNFNGNENATKMLSNRFRTNLKPRLPVDVRAHCNLNLHWFLICWIFINGIEQFRRNVPNVFIWLIQSVPIKLFNFLESKFAVKCVFFSAPDATTVQRNSFRVHVFIYFFLSLKFFFTKRLPP